MLQHLVRFFLFVVDMECKVFKFTLIGLQNLLNNLKKNPNLGHIFLKMNQVEKVEPSIFINQNCRSLK